MSEIQDIPQLKVSTGWLAIEIISEPNVVNTYKGYAPYVQVRTVINNLDYRLFISAKSLSDALEIFVAQNGGVFTSIRLKIKKESAEKMARFIVERL